MGIAKEAAPLRADAPEKPTLQRALSTESKIPFSQRATLALCAHLFADEGERRTSETKAARESVEAVLGARFLVRRMTPKTPPPKPISQYERRAAGSPTREEPGDLLRGKRRYRERSR
jgi:hypothetical protein